MIDQTEARRKLQAAQLALQDLQEKQWAAEQRALHDEYIDACVGALQSPVKAAALLDLQDEWQQPVAWQKIVTRRGVLQ